MGLSEYVWYVIYDDGTVEEVHCESIYDILEHIKSEQPRAIIKGGLLK